MRHSLRLATFLCTTSFSLCVHSLAHAEASMPDTTTAAPTRFEEMLTYVYEQHPRLKSERTTVKIADEKVSQANAGFRPNVSINGAAGYQREKISGGNWLDGSASSGSLVVTQPLFNGFGTVEQKRAAEARVLANRAHLLGTEQTVFFTAISDWLDLCEKEKILAVNQQNLTRLRAYSHATGQRFKAGDGTRTDIALADSRYAQAEARYATALAARDSARDSYERDTGLKAEISEFPPLPAHVPESRESAETLAGDNPALVQAQQEQDAAEHDIGTAESSLWPKIFLRGSMSDERDPSLGLSSLRNDSLTLNVSIPLYQGGGEYSRVREAKLARQKSRDDSNDIARAIRERAQLSWNNYISAQSVITSSNHAFDASARALSGVQEEQRQGLRTLTEVLDQQSENLAAEITQIQAQKSVRLEAYRLLAATGHLTAEDLALPVEKYDPTLHHDEVAPRWFGLEASN